MGDDRSTVEARVQRVCAATLALNPNNARRAAAELNGILTLLSEEPRDCRYHHILLCTDTWLGEQTGRIVEDWLRRYVHASVELRRQSDLQTENLQLFQSALSDLVQWLDSTIECYREQQYRVVFNLTGGFKSVQGFLQTLGNLYADETVYVFEAPGSPLLRIPRLPVRLDITDTVERRLPTIRRLANGLTVSPEERLSIPETFLLCVDEQVTISPWGTVIWEQTRKELYQRKLWESPSDRFEFGPHFRDSVKGLQSDRLLNLNDKLDKLAIFLEGDQVRPLQSLDLKKLKGNPTPPSTHEFDAWADRDAKRVYCHYEDTDTLILDRLGEALH
jgi:putative CRISPR-associated protein (TIGR02619 family)